MINYLKGKIIYKDNKSLTLENQGIGFKIFCSEKVLETFKEGEEVEIHTFLYLKEDKMDLYGFPSRAELNLFRILKGVSGVGPKISLYLSSFGSIENLKFEIEKGDFYLKVKGIGEKRMQKILLELTGKIKEASKKKNNLPNEAIDALSSLGFSRKEAENLLKKVPKSFEKTEDKIKEALKLARR